MPCLDVKIKVDQKVYVENGPKFVSEITELLCKEMNKPPEYFMVSLSHAMVTFGGNVKNDTAFCVLYYLSSQPHKDDQKQQDLQENHEKMKENISKIVGTQLEKHFDIHGKSYYLIFTDVGRDNWCWNKSIPFK